MAERKRKLRLMQGIVRSNKMDKTVVVEVTHRVLHQTYKKYMTRSMRYKAHDEQNICQVGDRVQIVESKPLSRDKRWRVKKVIEQTKY